MPRLFGHRGDPNRLVENTLPSFESAWIAGVRYLEMDVWLSKDGTAVVHHDRDFFRIYGLDAEVKDLTLKEIKRLIPRSSLIADKQLLKNSAFQDFSIPTLQEVLENFPYALFNIEIKQDSFVLVDEVLEVISKSGQKDSVLIASKYDHLIYHSAVLEEQIPFALGYNETKSFFEWIKSGSRESFETRGAALQLPEFFQGEKWLVPEYLGAAQDLGLEVHVWTVNDRNKVREYLEMGVDGIMSDDPVMLVQECS